MSEHLHDICEPCVGEPLYVPQSNPLKPYEFVGLRDIKVSEELLPNGTRRVTITNVDYVPPSINAQGNPSAEIGALVNFQFNVSIVKGSEEIVSRVINPDPGVDLNAPFNLNLVNFTSNTKGLKTAYNLSVTDERGSLLSVNFGAIFNPRVFMGYSTKDVIVAGDVSGFSGQLAGGIMDVYKGEKTYTVPTSLVNHYIWWLNPVGSTPIAKATMSGYELPLVVVPGNIEIINQYGVAINYVRVRTANSFGGGTLKITLQ